MSIKIYTYSNPYEIDGEEFWDDVRHAAHFCVSQTMVNGMLQTYPCWKDRRQLTTVRRLVNAMYADWCDVHRRVKQMMEVDNAVNALTIPHENADNIRRSLLFNTQSMAKCIALFRELGLRGADLNTERLNLDQQCLVEIYRAIEQRADSAFTFSRVTTREQADAAVRRALCENRDGVKTDEVDFDTVVIHGVHQFTPDLLCAIEDLAKWKQVILLFNYQPQYHAVYETWLNVYALFEQKMTIGAENEFTPMPLLVDSYESNVLGDAVGKLANGEYVGIDEDVQIPEVVEFENLTEFANYVARLFERAQKEREEQGSVKPTLSYMREQLYAASGEVNDILRAYFPEQFGERHFLDYPLGHFFVAAMNLWDDENGCTSIDNFSDVRECLSTGILQESRSGVLLSTFDKTMAFFEKEHSLSGVASKLKKLLKYINSDQEEKRRIGYFNVEKDDLKELIRAIGELQEILESFFTDFQNGGDNFRRFYDRIHAFISNRLLDLNDLDDEMKTVLEKLLARLDATDVPDTGTFNCLRQTMSYYLSQDPALALSANWIVRGFEQIDGDILRSKDQDPSRTCYHFCCLSDKDLYADRKAKLPWPLDIAFFEHAHLATEQKYRIFVKSKMEYHNFNRYALVYGLVFNRIGCKLSYVRRENEKENDLFYMLSMLGLSVKPYKSFENSSYTPKETYVCKDNDPDALPELLRSLSEVDQLKAKLCPYRFALESLVQGRTEYRDSFLIHTYLRVLIGHQILIEQNGAAFDEHATRERIKDIYDDMKSKFKLDDEVERTKLLAAVYRWVTANGVSNGRYRVLSPAQQQAMKLQEDFLLVSLKDVRNSPDVDLEELAAAERFRTVRGSHCMYCASKDVCLEYGADEGE